MAGDGVVALNIVEKTPPDLVLLDLGLPNMTGEAVCTQLKKHYPQIPVLILTARDSTSDIVSGLNIGADDYMTKPFDAEELLARIKARLRSVGVSDAKLSIDSLELDPNTMEAKRSGQPISLTPQEFKLLHYLMANQGRVLSREMILSRVWSYSPDVESRVVDIYIGYLRKKIDQGFPKKLIKSVRGFGYMVKED